MSNRDLSKVKKWFRVIRVFNQSSDIRLGDKSASFLINRTIAFGLTTFNLQIQKA